MRYSNEHLSPIGRNSLVDCNPNRGAMHGGNRIIKTSYQGFHRCSDETIRFHCVKPRQLLASIILAISLLGILTGSTLAQDSEDELGTWFIFNSTIRFSDRWSIFTEGQVRLWEATSNLEELFVRAAGHYDLSPKAMVGLGYLHAGSWPFEDANDGGRDRIENRIYQQFTMKQTLARALFEHRFRLEQRWFEEDGATDFSNRGRYRLQVTIPLNHETMRPGTYFINTFDEIFINFGGGERSFDQNRLYVAGGHQFTPDANLQLGLLWQARTSTDFFRLQIFYTHNFDLRKH